MDFLGLRNLTVLDDAVRGIKANRGTDVDLETLALDDKPTYDLLARGDTLGIFQFDGGPMRALLRSMRARNTMVSDLPEPCVCHTTPLRSMALRPVRRPWAILLAARNCW